MTLKRDLKTTRVSKLYMHMTRVRNLYTHINWLSNLYMHITGVIHMVALSDMHDRPVHEQVCKDGQLLMVIAQSHHVTNG